MKKLGVLGTTLFISAMILSGCGDNKQGSVAHAKEKSTTYNYIYTAEMSTLDYTVSSRTTNGNHFYNFMEGLMAFDEYGQLQPALAKDWEISADQKTYTYHLQQGVSWSDYQGNVVGEVTAADFVTGLKHAVEAKSETLYIVADSIVGLKDYIDGKLTDFSKVGIKAVDDYTISYTLNQPEPYWNSKTTYGILYPVQEAFLKEKGEDFGTPLPDSILYNGPYLLANATAKSVIEYEKNPNYWDQKHVYVDEVKLTYADGSDPDAYYKGFDEGKFDKALVYPNNAAFKDVKEKYQENLIWSLPDQSTYNITMNLGRRTYDVTSKNEEEKQDTKQALYNKKFRQALEFSFKKETMLAQTLGQDAAKEVIRNSYVPGKFAMIDGKPMSESTLNNLKELNPDLYQKVTLEDGKDGFYQPEMAKKLLKEAKEELKSQNVHYPIHLDFPQIETKEVNVNQVKSFKQMVEDTLGKENVVIDIQLLSEDAYNSAVYMAGVGAATDFDLSIGGWSADYNDPKAFLNVFQSENGDLLDTVGFDPVLPGQKDASKEAKDKVNMKEYDGLLQKANQITNDLTARYEAYSQAEAWLLDSAIQIPLNAAGGNPVLTKEQPFTRPMGIDGKSETLFKGLKLLNHPLTAEEYQDYQGKWQEKRAQVAKEVADKTAEKYQQGK